MHLLSVSHRHTDSDLIQQHFRSAGGQGRLSGLYNTFLARFISRQIFLWIPFLDTDHHLAHPTDLEVSTTFSFFLHFFFQMYEGNLYYGQQHWYNGRGGKGYRSRGVSHFLNQRYPTFIWWLEATRGRGGSGARTRSGEYQVARPFCFHMRFISFRYHISFWTGDLVKSNVWNACSDHLDGKIDYDNTSR